jgi:hypothetical protein
LFPNYFPLAVFNRKISTQGHFEDEQQSYRAKDGCFKTILPAGFFFERLQRRHQAGFQGGIHILSGNGTGCK